MNAVATCEIEVRHTPGVQCVACDFGRYLPPEHQEPAAPWDTLYPSTNFVASSSAPGAPMFNMALRSAEEERADLEKWGARAIDEKSRAVMAEYRLKTRTEFYDRNMAEALEGYMRSRRAMFAWGFVVAGAAISSLWWLQAVLS